MGRESGRPENSKSTDHYADRVEPYENLYIYLIGGRVKDHHASNFGTDFLGNWVEDDTSFLFFSKPSHDVVSELLGQECDLTLIDDYHFTYEQWQGAPSGITRIENLVILPPWLETGAAGDEKKIILDPGVVFGNGLHPTTRDCLKAMVALRRQYRADRVLDLGTGTGILALAAACLGAEGVVAVDLNPLCVKTAQKNVALNRFSGKIAVYEGGAEDFADVPADLVISNLQHDALAALLERKVFKGKRWLIFSGLMRSQATDIGVRMEKHGLRIVREWDHEMTWYTLLVQNPESDGFVKSP